MQDFGMFQYRDILTLHVFNQPLVPVCRYRGLIAPDYPTGQQSHKRIPFTTFIYEY